MKRIGFQSKRQWAFISPAQQKSTESESDCGEPRVQQETGGGFVHLLVRRRLPFATQSPGGDNINPLSSLGGTAGPPSTDESERTQEEGNHRGTFGVIRHIELSSNFSVTRHCCVCCLFLITPICGANNRWDDVVVVAYNHLRRCRSAPNEQ